MPDGLAEHPLVNLIADCVIYCLQCSQQCLVLWKRSQSFLYRSLVGTEFRHTEFQHKERGGRNLETDGVYHSILSRDDMINGFPLH